MSFVKTLALGFAAAVAVGFPARGAALTNGTWRWTTWSPASGVVLNSAQLAPSAPISTVSSLIPTVVTPYIAQPTTVPAAAAVATSSSAPDWQNMGRWATTPGLGTTPAATSGAAAVISTPAAAPAVALPMSIPASSASSSSVPDGFINFTSGPFAQPGSSTNYAAQPWYQSGLVKSIYGGNTPNAAQQAAFSQEVLDRVSTAYQRSGVPASFTLDPNAGAPHTLSVVSTPDSATLGTPVLDKLGETQIGGNGMTFIDQFHGATSPKQLADAVGENVAHEMMHAFGIAEHHDATGTFIDSGSADPTLLNAADPVFSAAAVQDLLSRNFKNVASGFTMNVAPSITSAQLYASSSAAPVPEPTTILCWTVACLALGLRGRRRLSLRRDA
ncbi:hypothetical protein EP7_001324 [Isosphaeraceae bacterium EP7]